MPKKASEIITELNTALEKTKISDWKKTTRKILEYTKVSYYILKKPLNILDLTKLCNTTYPNIHKLVYRLKDKGQLELKQSTENGISVMRIIPKTPLTSTMLENKLGRLHKYQEEYKKIEQQIAKILKEPPKTDQI